VERGSWIYSIPPPPTWNDFKRVSRQARELSILLLVVFVLKMVCGGGGGHFVHFVEISTFWSHFGAREDFLGVALAESIG